MYNLLIFPNQLYSNIKKICDDLEINKIIIIEEPAYFTRYKFHKQKLLLHRASMKYFEDYCIKNTDCKVSYIEFHKVTKSFYSSFNKENTHYFDPTDKPLQKKINKFIKHDTLLFLETIEELEEFKKTVKNNNYRHDLFYKWQRQRLNILMDKNEKPLYGKYSFDTLNRQPFKNYEEPIHNIKKNEYITEAIKYVNKHFNENTGEIDEFNYPITHTEAKNMLKFFIKNKIKSFGKFQDAVKIDVVYGSHSCLSSSLNIGLITINEVLEEILNFFDDASDKKNQIQNVEAIIRQLIGWRSYVRMIYEFHGEEIMKMNYLKHNREIIWDEKNIFTNHFIEKVNKYAYLHHIERLMFIGNWFLLSEIHPKKVYDWFMINFIDSYEWVMVANIFGMSQYSTEPKKIKIMTRPYLCSSNYIFKMSDFKKDGYWDIIMNALYYRFVSKNYDMLKKNYSTANITYIFDKMDKDKKKEYLKIAKDYLE